MAGGVSGMKVFYCKEFYVYIQFESLNANIRYFYEKISKIKL